MPRLQLENEYQKEVSNRPDTIRKCNDMLDRIRAGDDEVWNELLSVAWHRLHRKTHYILRGNLSHSRT